MIETKVNFTIELPNVDRMVKAAETIVDRNHVADLIRVADSYVAKKIQEGLKRVDVKQS